MSLAFTHLGWKWELGAELFFSSKEYFCFLPTLLSFGANSTLIYTVYSFTY
jgi:hypothetical protein